MHTNTTEPALLGLSTASLRRVQRNTSARQRLDELDRRED